MVLAFTCVASLNLPVLQRLCPQGLRPGWRAVLPGSHCRSALRRSPPQRPTVWLLLRPRDTQTLSSNQALPVPWAEGGSERRVGGGGEKAVVAGLKLEAEPSQDFKKDKAFLSASSCFPARVRLRAGPLSPQPALRPGPATHAASRQSPPGWQAHLATVRP